MEGINNIYYINKEIAIIQKELYDLEYNKNLYKGSSLTGMPKGGNETDIFNYYAGEKEKLEDMLQYNLKELQHERRKAETLLNTIEDPETRLIVRLRIVNNMKWEEIGEMLEMSRTTVSRKYYKFLQKK